MEKIMEEGGIEDDGSLVVCMVALPSGQFFATNDTNFH